MESSYMLRTLITDAQQYYSASLRCYATSGKLVAHLSFTCDVAASNLDQCTTISDPHPLEQFGRRTNRGSSVIASTT
jgi:hypothetical protein